MALSNLEIWNTLRNLYPSFASHTAEGTAETFTSAGFDALSLTDVNGSNAVNEFFGLSLRTKLIDVNISHAKDDFESNGFGETYSVPFGAIIQKMAVYPLKPATPKYKGLADGDSVDPGVVRKPITGERFFKQNFDYYNWVTIPDDFQRKQIFISEFGISEWTAGIMEQLQNAYTIQKYENKLECLNKALNSTKYPLLDTQKMQVSLSLDNSSTSTNEEAVDFIYALMNVIEAMSLAPQTGAYNAMSFPTIQDKSRLCLLLRPGYLNKIMTTLPQVFRYQVFGDKGNILQGLNYITVPNFGGLVPYKEAEFTTRLYPHYTTAGIQDGWSTSEGGELDSTVTQPYYQDPNSGIIGILADKGLIFEGKQNEYRVEPWRNPAGLYTNFHCSVMNNTIAVDPIYNMIAIGNFS